MASTSPKPETPLRALVVDDERLVRQVVTRMLTEEGFEVLEAQNGQEALDSLSRHACDLMVCDIVMPEMEGVETCYRLSHEYPDLRIVMMSGATMGRSWLDNTKHLGAHSVLSKPFRQEELMSAVREALEN